MISQSSQKHKIRLIHASASDVEQVEPEETTPFDLIYLDCDKRKYLEYYEYIMKSPLIQEGSMIIADNVLWKDISALSSNLDEDDGVISRRPLDFSCDGPFKCSMRILEPSRLYY